MLKKDVDQKDYIEEHDEWQRNQFNPGYFTGGKVPVWIKKPGNRKRLGVAFFVGGIFYGVWAIYSINMLNQGVAMTESLVSAVFLGIAAIIFLWAGIKLIKKSGKNG